MKIIKYFFEFISIISLFCIFKIIGFKKCIKSWKFFRKNLLVLFLDQKILLNKILKLGWEILDEKRKKNY